MYRKKMLVKKGSARKDGSGGRSFLPAGDELPLMNHYIGKYQEKPTLSLSMFIIVRKVEPIASPRPSPESVR